MADTLHVPQITITEYLPKVTRERYLGHAPPWSQVEFESVSYELIPDEPQEPTSLLVQKYGACTQLLTPDTESRCTTPDSESTPLLDGSRARKTSFGYKDKKFDEDVAIVSKLYTEEKSKNLCLSWGKIITLALITFVCVGIYTAVTEQNENYHQLSLSSAKNINISLNKYYSRLRPLLRLTLIGPFVNEHVTGDNDTLMVSLNSLSCIKKKITTKNQYLRVLTEDGFEESKINVLFKVDEDPTMCNLYLSLSTNSLRSFPLALHVNDLPNKAKYGVIYAGLILLGLYCLIIFEIVHRSLAAMLAATVAISVLSAINEKPTLTQIMNWIDIETLCLLFGMMVIVAMLCETGFFDYLAVYIYKLTKGRIWMLLTVLCFATAIVSAFLDNVTTILLLTPVTIRLSEVVNLNPKYVLIALVIFSNVGGTATAVGDPPNVIIVSNQEIKDAGIEFVNFTMHLGLGIIFVLVVTYCFMAVMYINWIPLTSQDPPEVAEIKQEIQVWKRAAKSLSLYSRDEDSVRKKLLRKVSTLENKLKKQLYNTRPNEDDYRASLSHLEQNYKIRDWPLLIKCGFVLFCVISMFFLHSIVPGMNISLGWIALMGAILLLVLADLSDVEHLFSWVEWSTLIFFAALFVVMEALTEMGLLEAIGTATEDFILGIEQNMRLPISIILILWVSALASSFIDNIPFTTVMLKIVLKLGQNPSLGLPLQPLVWALAFGACLGGNGTLIGASANVVCAGVAEQHGYRFTFLEFFKIGFPTMLVTTFVAMIYLLICHVAIGWNYS